MNSEKQHASLFDLDGVPKMSQAIPLALQHVVAMIVGCVTPAIIISGAAGIDTADRVILIQASLVVSALATLLQLFPLGKKGGLRLGAGLPVILGVSFAYVPSMQAIAEQYGIATILGSQIAGGICAVIVGIMIKKIRKFFPPLIAGTVVFTIGLSLYPTAINYMAGGTGQPTYGSWQNWTVAIFTLIVVTVLNHFAKGFLKLASILVGMIAGYIFSMFFGMVSFTNVGEAGMFQLPHIMHFGINFEISACVAIGLLFVINSVQAIGDFSATTAGGLDREPTTDELQGAILGYGITNVIGAFLGCLPTATYSQNVGIVATTKVVNRVTLGISALVILVAGLFPKFSALLTTIPYAVLGGATVSVFASIAMTGMKLVMTEEMNYRNTSIVGLAAALGMGVSQASASLSSFPAWVTTIFGKSPVVIATLVAILLNVTLPREKNLYKTNK
ncbi:MULTISPECIES: nucleobase:cation symporter-2 family protein [Enterocloster]|uniref:Nucleobase:cation symporter-2, NCS2 family n=1 Tax=Enterocloster lavalensis TaxID=460384 RepID=A0A1I0FSQ8_9FIRM|nr:MULTISPECIES: nucleobase:cation symporter-2 family protein [Enterocloster]MDR3759095.1 nucleobase:cation symporter-2 family protein [Enterocloster sp.]SET61550.1 nucleobase:cation symporter-2, NCS2 family [Enterocloster lavalensis]